MIPQPHGGRHYAHNRSAVAPRPRPPGHADCIRPGRAAPPRPDLTQHTATTASARQNHQ